MQDIEGNIAKLRALRQMGVNIAIDDFGTGYSSLGYLARLPINALKIDRSFVTTMGDNDDSMTIVSTIISLAHSMSLRVIAEGVDAPEQRRLLQILKCDEIQGYLVSRPVPPEEIARLLHEDAVHA
jgi:EAL domain-containing protein (putative c-di-GMP-specific phosphodiesterase class I)